MHSDFVKNMSAYADQNHAPSLAAARLEYNCSLAPDEVRILPQKTKNLEKCVNPLDFNFPEIHNFLENSIFTNCRFRIARKKKKCPIPDAAWERV